MLKNNFKNWGPLEKEIIKAINKKFPKAKSETIFKNFDNLSDNLTKIIIRLETLRAAADMVAGACSPETLGLDQQQPGQITDE
jgi:hypothetical protein